MELIGEKEVTAMTALSSQVQHVRSVVHVCRDASSKNQRKFFLSFTQQVDISLKLINTQLVKPNVFSGWDT